MQYFGAMGNANALDILIRAVSLASARSKGQVRLRLFGAGPRRPSLIALASELGLQGIVTFHEEVPRSEVPEVMSWGNSLAVVVADHSGLYQYGISPNKLFDYLASGQWIVMGADVPNNPIDDAPGALVVPPTPEAMAGAMLHSLTIKSTTRPELALANRDVVRRNYDFQILAKRLSEALNAL